MVTKILMKFKIEIIVLATCTHISLIKIMSKVNLRTVKVHVINMPQHMYVHYRGRPLFVPTQNPQMSDNLRLNVHNSMTMTPYSYRPRMPLSAVTAECVKDSR